MIRVDLLVTPGIGFGGSRSENGGQGFASMGGCSEADLTGATLKSSAMVCNLCCAFLLYCFVATTGRHGYGMIKCGIA